MGESKSSNALLPALSVLVNNYNYARFIGEALEAILNQSYRPKEVIVVDDASTDNSVEIVQQFVNRDPIVRLIKNEVNMGCFYGMNKFLSMASGEYVYMAGSDDRILPGFFEKSVKLLARYPNAGLCSTLSYKIDEKGRNMGFLITPIVYTRECFISPEKAISIAKKIGGWVPGQSVIYKPKALNAVGGFKPELNAANDAVAVVMIACKYGVCFIPEALVCIRDLPNSYSARIHNDLDGLKDVYKSLRELSVSGPLKELVTQESTKQTDAVFSYIINTLTLSQLQDKEIDFIKEQMPPKRFLEKVLYVLIKLIVKFGKTIYHLYAFAHSERKIHPVIYNRLFRSLHFRMLYFIARIRRKLD